MAFPRPINCNTNPIDGIERDLLQAMSDAHTTISSAIQDANGDTDSISELVDNGNELLQDLLNSGDPNSNIKVLSDLSENFEIDGEGSQLEDELYMKNVVGIVMINGVIFKEGEEGSNVSNIEVLRRVYQGVGRDLSRVDDIYNSNRSHNFVFETIIQTLEPTEPGTNPSIDDIQRRIGVPWLPESQVVYTDNNQAIAVYRKSLTRDQPISTVSNRLNIKKNRLTSTVLHYNNIQNTTASINSWISLGYQNQINFILDGVDPLESDSVPIDDSINQARQLASTLTTDIDFTLSRLDRLNTSESLKLKNRLLKKTDELESLLVTAINTVLFKVSVLEQKDTLSRLREKLDDDSIEYLLNSRTDVSGIDFDATTQEILGIASQARSIRAGDITASSLLLNSQSNGRDEILTNLLEMFKLIGKSRNQIERITKSSLTEAKQILVSFIGVNPNVLETSNGPVRGFTGMATPSSILAQRLDFDRSFSINLKFGALDDALEKFQELFSSLITGPVTALVEMISNMFKSAHAIIGDLTESLKEKIMPLKRRLDGFIAKYLSLIGQGSFDNSLLKCAVNFNIGLSTNILDQLLRLIEDLGALVQNLVTKVQRIVSDMIEKILCVPINMVDKLTSQGESYLPSFCSITIPFELGEDLESALLDLRNACSFKNVNLTGFRGDLVSYRTIVSTANNRLNQFNRSAVCQSDLVDRAFNTTLVNIQGGVGLPTPF